MITILGDGTYTYTPTTDFNGLDTVVVSICDAGTPGMECVNDTIFITVNPINDPPIAVDDNVFSAEDIPSIIDVKENDIDRDGIIDSTSVTTNPGLNQPSDGMISIEPTNGEITYTPNTNFVGADDFEYIICDDGLPILCDTALVTINVGATNDPPVAVNDTLYTDEDVSITADLTPNDMDIDGLIDPLSVSTNPGLIQSSNGSVTIDPMNGEVTYTPNMEFSGLDQFEYIVCDNATPALCDTALVTIFIAILNDAPVAVDDLVSTTEDVPTIINVDSNDMDIDGVIDSTSVSTNIGLNQPDNGTILIDPVNGDITYTPNVDFSGTDTFEYIVCDDGAPVLCDTALVTVTVDPVNDPPVAVDDLTTTDEDVAVIINVDGNDTDIDGIIDSTTVSSPLTILQPTDGAISINVTNGAITYTPDSDFTGTDTFEYIICDDGSPVLCDTALVTITVNPVNDPPIAVDDNIFAEEDQSTIIVVTENDNDPDGLIDSTSVTINPGLNQPSNGTVSINPVNGEIIYTPNTNFVGIDDFEYIICDDGTPVLCDTALVTVNVGATNDPPIAINDTLYIDEDNFITVDLSINDIDIDGLIDPQSVSTNPGMIQPSNGSISINPSNGEVSYTPETNYFGEDQFEYIVCDDASPALCDTALVTVYIASVNDPPIAVDDNSTIEDMPVEIDVAANDYDLDDVIDPTSVSVNPGLTQPTHGSISINPVNGFITYTPDVNYNGLDSFEYIICDSASPALCDTALVSINVAPVNDPPIIVNDTTSTLEDTPIAISVLANDLDIDNGLDTNTVSTNMGLIQPTNGSISIDSITGVITYTPDPDFNGTDEFQYTVCDKNAPPLCDTALVYVTIDPVNDTLVVDNEFHSIDQNTNASGDLTDAGDFDPDGTILSANPIPVSGPSAGNITISIDGTYSYTPDLDYTGTDTIVVEICDAGEPGIVCANDTIFILVVDVSACSPIASSPLTDTDGDGLTDCEETTGDDNPNTPEIPSRISDPNDPCDPIASPGSDCSDPQAEDDFVSTSENVPVDITVIINDTFGVDGAAMADISVTIAPMNGTSMIDDNGTPNDPTDDFITYTPHLNYSGLDSLIYEICDSDGECESAMVHITIVDVNLCSPIESSPLTDTDNDGLTDCEETTGEDNPNTPLVPTRTSDPNDSCDPNPNPAFDCDDPVAVDDVISTTEDTPVTVDVLANDDFGTDNPKPNTVAITGDPINGTATVEDNGSPFDPTDDLITYTPNMGYSGMDSLTYQICDSNDDCVTAVVRINIIDTDACSPIATSPLTDTDNDGLTDCEEITGLDNPNTPNIPIGPSDPNDICDPIANSPLTDSDNDGLTDCEETTGNDNPNTTAIPPRISDPNDMCDPIENSPMTDSDGDGLTDCEETTGNDNPNTTAIPPRFSDPNDACDPIENSPLTDTDNDGLTDCEESTGNDNPNTSSIPPGISNPNDGCDPFLTPGNNCSTPTANDDNITVVEDIPLAITVIDNDDFGSDGPANTVITITTSPLNGSAIVNDNGTVNDPTDDFIDYTPTLGFDGLDSLTYQICDSNGDCDDAIVRITIQDANACNPIASSPLTDTDGDGLTDCEETTGNDNPNTPAIPVGTSDPNDICDPIANSPLTDTDGDGLTDCEETTGNDNPNTPAIPIGTTDPMDICDPIVNSPLTDSDNDGLTDCEETTGNDNPNTSAVPSGTSDPMDICDPIANSPLTDMDNDGLTDCEESSGNDNPNTIAIPTGTSNPNDPCDPNPSAIPTGDCDGDGNPNNTDPNAGIPVAAADNDAVSVGSSVTIDLLINDDFISNDDPLNSNTTTITNLGTGTAQGSVTINQMTGTLTYTPLVSEAGNTVNIYYEVCNTDPDPDVCATARVDIVITAAGNPCDPIASSPLTDTDNDGLTDCEETTGNDNPNTTAVPLRISNPMDACDPTPGADPAGDCDGDGNPNATDPNPGAPQASNDTTIISFGELVSYNIFTNDDYLPNDDPNNLGDNIVVNFGTGTALGSIAFDPATGIIEYLPLASEIGSTVTVVYEVCNIIPDPDACSTATVFITIAPPNLTTSDTINVTIGALTDTLSLCADTSELAGALTSVTIDTIHYSGNLDFVYNGACVDFDADNFGSTTDTLAVIVCDDMLVCDTTIMVINVNGIAPQAVDNDTLTLTDRTVTIRALDNDLLNGTLTDLMITNPPTAGTVLTIGGEVFIYTPDPRTCGQLDSFEYAITTLAGTSNATVYIDIICGDLIVHNGFSPNGDGVNDGFAITGIENFPDNRVCVYNRWGNRVFLKDNYENSDQWNGVWEGKTLPNGTYFYSIQDNNGDFIKTGYVQIWR